MKGNTCTSRILLIAKCSSPFFFEQNVIFLIPKCTVFCLHSNPNSLRLFTKYVFQASVYISFIWLPYSLQVCLILLKSALEDWRSLCVLGKVSRMRDRASLFGWRHAQTSRLRSLLSLDCWVWSAQLARVSACHGTGVLTSESDSHGHCSHTEEWCWFLELSCLLPENCKLLKMHGLAVVALHAGPLDHWFSTCGKRTSGGTRKYLTGYVKLETNMILWLNTE